MSHDVLDLVSRLVIGSLYLTIAVGTSYHSFDVGLYGRKVILRLIAVVSTFWSLFYYTLALLGGHGTDLMADFSRIIHGVTIGTFGYILWNIRFYVRRGR